jgi:hypothetical protein
MTMASPKNPTPETKDQAHTELRRQDEQAEQGAEPSDGDAAETPLKPRTPVERLPLDDDGDDLFNDVPV